MSLYGLGAVIFAGVTHAPNVKSRGDPCTLSVKKRCGLRLLAPREPEGAEKTAVVGIGDVGPLIRDQLEICRSSPRVRVGCDDVINPFGAFVMGVRVRSEVASLARLSSQIGAEGRDE